MSFGNIGRTDQGVDISAPAGTNVPNIFGGDVRLIGVIRNWYQGQPYEWFKVLTGKLKDAYVYGAEQINFTSYRPGTIIRSRGSLGRIAASGTGTEFGFATPSGRTLAQATTGYTEGQPTPAGLRFRSFLGSQGASAGRANNHLANLWIQAGGSPAVANIMAAIAMAESSGNVAAKGGPNSDGTYDYGLWQINSSHSQYDPNRLTSDPLYNARAAVAVYRSQGLTAWSTYNSGAYRPFLPGASSASANFGGPNGGLVRPGGDSVGPSASLTADYVSLDSQRQAPQQVGFDPFAPFKWWYKNFSDSWSNFYHDLTGPADALVKTGEATASFASEGVKVLENLPFYFLRATEFVIGVFLMYLGVRSVTSGGPSTASIARVTREIGAATPAGRARRMARGRRMGSQEGEIEHARLTARREARQREARREQERGQRRRELRNPN